MSEPRSIYEPGMWPDLAGTDRHEELKSWLRANGINPDDVAVSGTISVEPTNPAGGQLIRHTVYLHNVGGRKYFDEATGDAAQEERVVLLAVEPPFHWYVKEPA